jgi:hypothetical protein
MFLDPGRASAREWSPGVARAPVKRVPARPAPSIVLARVIVIVVCRGTRQRSGNCWWTGSSTSWKTRRPSSPSSLLGRGRTPVRCAREGNLYRGRGRREAPPGTEVNANQQPSNDGPGLHGGWFAMASEAQVEQDHSPASAPRARTGLSRGLCAEPSACETPRGAGAKRLSQAPTRNRRGAGAKVPTAGVRSEFSRASD